MRTRDEQKEEAIREEAVKIVVKDGLDGLSMQKLAKAAGVSPATIYIYYKDREDLILQIYLWLTRKMFDHTMEGFDPEMHFADGLRVQWQNRAKYFLAFPMEMLFLEQCRHSPVHDKALELGNNPFREVMRKFVTTAIKRKELDPLPFEVYWSIAYAPLYQLLKYHTQGRTHATDHFSISDQAINQALGLVLKALKP